MKNSIKREQSQACLNFAERKNFRLQAKHKILMTLALLLTAATGAWATDGVLLTTITAADNSSFKSGSQTFGDVATVTLTGDYLINDGSHGGWYCQGSNKTATISVAAANGANITSVKFYTAGGGSAEDKDAPFEVTTTTVTSSNITTYLNGNSIGSYGVSKIEVYGTAEPPIEVTPVAEPAANTKQWTFSMPGSDVVLTPQYAPAAKWDVVENVEQLPAALEGIIAGQDAAIVTAGQSAQGTVMYAVTTTAEPAPALTAFSATVPTAKDYDDATTLYVWYYIQGQDTPDGQEATEENTFNDTEICTTPLTVQVLTNKFDITFNAANANTIETGNATVTVGGTAATVTEGKLEGVKMGSEVKMTAKQGYKFRKVEVKKKAAAPEYYDQLSAGYNVTINVINSYVWSHNIFGQVGFTSGISSSIWNAMTITKEQAIALAEYKGSTSLVLYDKGEGSDDGYGGKNVLYKFAKSDGTTVDIERHVNIKNNPSILEGYTVYYIPKNAN